MQSKQYSVYKQIYHWQTCRKAGTQSQGPKEQDNSKVVGCMKASMRLMHGGFLYVIVAQLGTKAELHPSDEKYDMDGRLGGA